MESPDITLFKYLVKQSPKEQILLHPLLEKYKQLFVFLFLGVGGIIAVDHTQFPHSTHSRKAEPAHPAVDTVPKKDEVQTQKRSNEPKENRRNQ